MFTSDKPPLTGTWQIELKDGKKVKLLDLAYLAAQKA